MPDPNLRAADADRQAVAAVLGRALSDGRLTVEEYEERLTKAYTAKTYGELDELTADLPRPGAVKQSAVPPPGRTQDRAPAPGTWGRRAMWAPWLTTALIVTAIWLATSIGNGRPDHFWPVWVIVPWGAVLLARTVTGGPSRGARREYHHYPHDRRPRC